MIINNIPKKYAEMFLKKYNVKHDAVIEEVRSVPTASDLDIGSFIINVLPSGDVRGFVKSNDTMIINRVCYSVLHMIDGKFVDTVVENISTAKSGMSKKGKFYTLDREGWDLFRKHSDDTSADVLSNRTGDIYRYMNKTFLPKIQVKMESMLDDIYTNLRKLDSKKVYTYSKSEQEQALYAANVIEKITKAGFNRKVSEDFINKYGRLSYGFGSIPSNDREFERILKSEPNARAKMAKVILDNAMNRYTPVKELINKVDE